MLTYIVQCNIQVNIYSHEQSFPFFPFEIAIIFQLLNIPLNQRCVLHKWPFHYWFLRLGLNMFTWLIQQSMLKWIGVTEKKDKSVQLSAYSDLLWVTIMQYCDHLMWSRPVEWKSILTTKSSNKRTSRIEAMYAESGTDLSTFFQWPLSTLTHCVEQIR